MILCLAILAEHQVEDRRMDGQTQSHRIYHNSKRGHGKTPQIPTRQLENEIWCQQSLIQVWVKIKHGSLKWGFIASNTSQ